MNMPTETLKIVVRTLYTGETDIHIENVQVRFSPLKEVNINSTFAVTGPAGGLQLPAGEGAEHPVYRVHDPEPGRVQLRGGAQAGGPAQPGEAAPGLHQLHRRPLPAPLRTGHTTISLVNYLTKSL